MKLYILPGACSMASNIALHEAGIQFEVSKVDRRTKRADGVDFTTINPKGYVPALKLDSGQVLTENVVVLQYIADLNPAAKLAPPAGTPCASTSASRASAPRCTTRWPCTCSHALPDGAIAQARSRTRRRPPEKRWRCPSSPS